MLTVKTKSASVFLCCYSHHFKTQLSKIVTTSSMHRSWLSDLCQWAVCHKCE